MGWPVVVLATLLLVGCSTPPEKPAIVLGADQQQRCLTTKQQADDLTVRIQGVVQSKAPANSAIEKAFEVLNEMVLVFLGGGEAQFWKATMQTLAPQDQTTVQGYAVRHRLLMDEARDIGCPWVIEKDQQIQLANERDKIRSVRRRPGY